MYTVGQLKDGVAGLVSGTNIDKVTGVYKVFERAARKLVTKADIPEATQKLAMTLYSGVTDYIAPSKIFGSALIDIRPQGVSRWFGESVQKMPVEFFDRTKGMLPGGSQVAFEHKDGVPIIRIVASRANEQATLDWMNETTGWTASGSASGLTRDTISYYDSPASLRFTLTGSSTGILTKTISSLNIESYQDVAVAFLALRIPDGATATTLSSIELRLGSDDTNYDSVTATEGFLGAWTVGEWLLIALDMSTSTSTGTPDWTAIDYVQVRFAHTATLTNIRIGGLWIAPPSPHEILFQTSAIFLNGTTRNLTITDDEDQIVLNEAAYLLYEHECALGIAVQQNQENKAANLRTILYGKEGTNDEGLYAEYRGDNPSEELRQIGSYYNT